MAETFSNPESKPRRHFWPWIVAAMFLLGVVLAVVWLKREIRNVEQRKQYEIPR